MRNEEFNAKPAKKLIEFLKEEFAELPVDQAEIAFKITLAMAVIDAGQIFSSKRTAEIEFIDEINLTSKRMLKLIDKGVGDNIVIFPNWKI